MISFGRDYDITRDRVISHLYHTYVITPMLSLETVCYHSRWSVITRDGLLSLSQNYDITRYRVISHLYHTYVITPMLSLETVCYHLVGRCDITRYRVISHEVRMISSVCHHSAITRSDAMISHSSAIRQTVCYHTPDYPTVY